MQFSDITLTEIKDVATIIGIGLAYMTYRSNSNLQARTKNIENMQRYFDAHDALFEADGYLISIIHDLENDTYVRDITDKEMEKKINRFLGDIEKIAFLTAHDAVSIEIQVYMFGWFAQKIRPHLTNGEREEVFWELAIHYIDELKKAADDYKKLPTLERENYLKKNTLLYKKFQSNSKYVPWG